MRKNVGFHKLGAYNSDMKIFDFFKRWQATTLHRPSESELVKAQCAIEVRAKELGVAPYRLAAKFTPDGSFEEVIPLFPVNPQHMGHQFGYWNPDNPSRN